MAGGLGQDVGEHVPCDPKRLADMMSTTMSTAVCAFSVRVIAAKEKTDTKIIANHDIFFIAVSLPEP